MKKILAALLCAVILVCLCACGGDSDSGESMKLKDVMTTDSMTFSYNDTRFVYVYESDGKPMRVTAEFDAETAEKLEAIDFFADDRDQQVIDTVGDKKIIKVEDLSAGIPSQEELDQYIGKKGQELLADGYEIGGHEFVELATWFTMVKGDYEFEFEFEEIIPEEKYDIPDEEIIVDLTVKSVKYAGLSYNATNIN